MPLRPARDLEFLAVCAAVAGGCGVMLGLWFYSGVAATARAEAHRREAAGVASRHMNAQESLSTIRAMVLLSSVRFRDALLEPASSSAFEDQRQMAAAYRLARLSIDEYEPVLGRASQQAELDRLTRQVDELHATSVRALANAARQSPAQIRDVLNRELGPRLDAALQASEEIQALNRQALVARQADLVAIHEAAEALGRRQLIGGLAAGLGATLVAAAYALRLRSRLRRASLLP